MTKVALFGGSFDPPHLGHQLVLSYLLGSSDLDLVVLCPTGIHALGKQLQSFDSRFDMTCLMAEIFDNNRVQISYAENWLVTKGGYKDSRTITLVDHYKKNNPEVDLHLVIGSDLLEQAKTWDNWDQIQEKAKPIVVGRLGYGNEKLVLPNISSTEIRKDIDAMSHHLPHKVYKYIKHHRLYGSKGDL